MSAPTAPWTERLVARSRRLLAAGLLAALVTTAATVYLARNDGHVEYVLAAPRAAAQAGGGTFRLDRLSTLPGSDDTMAAVEGATFVIADLTADLSTVPQDGGCLVYLKAGDYWFRSEFGYTPSDPQAAPSCSGGAKGRISMAFQVPLRLVDDVDGVRIDIADGDELIRTVLPGTIG